MATLSAAVGLLLVADRLVVQGWLRQLIGWGVLVGSTVAFTAVQFYMFRKPGLAPARPVILAIDAGTGLFLIALALFVLSQGREFLRKGKFNSSL